MKIYCITTQDEHYNKIKNLGLIPVGLGDKIISNKFISDSSNINISNKNPFYGEYTFHYWLWKNSILNKEKGWIGFCQYRKFWGKKKSNYSLDSIENLKNNIITEVPKNLKTYDVILGDPIYINQLRLSKFLKKNFKTMIKKPSLFFNKELRNIKFHFNMMHGDGNLDKAIKLLELQDRDDFNNFVSTEVSFNPHNMFMCKSYEVLERYYKSVFPWLERCEKEFGFNLQGYGLRRMYGFLAERYMSFWFNKYTKVATLPIIFKDITDLN